VGYPPSMLRGWQVMFGAYDTGYNCFVFTKFELTI
jgi:hypothetical protein